MYTKLHNYHWNIVGFDFFEFHETLQEMYEFITEEIGRIAKRIKMLGYMPVSNLEDALKTATIKGAPSVNFSAPTIAHSIISDFTITINEIRRVSEIAGQNNDEYTVALLSESLGLFGKYTWFFRAYLTSACPGY